MKKIVLFPLLSVVFMFSLGGIFLDNIAEDLSFTEAEKELIMQGDRAEIMQVLAVPVEADTSDVESMKMRASLTSISKEVDFEIDKENVLYLADRLLATVNDPKNPGVGIAAPQVGVNRRIIYVQRLDKKSEPFECCINPEIIAHGDSLVSREEGCLSVLELYAPVSRFYRIEITYLNANGEQKNETVSGFTARIFQHEIDHLDGVLFFERL